MGCAFLSDLDCYFGQGEFYIPPVRCHHRSTDDFALSLDLVTTTRLEVPLFSRPNGIQFVDTQVSLSMDLPNDNTSIPYGYGEIEFYPVECTLLSF